MKQHFVEKRAAKRARKGPNRDAGHVLHGTGGIGRVLCTASAHELVALGAGDVAVVAKRGGNFSDHAERNVARPLRRCMADTMHFRASDVQRA